MNNNSEQAHYATEQMYKLNTIFRALGDLNNALATPRVHWHSQDINEAIGKIIVAYMFAPGESSGTEDVDACQLGRETFKEYLKNLLDVHKWVRVNKS